MGDELKTESPPEAQAPQTQSKDTALDILKTEYTALLDLYAHTENAILTAFNFYLTLLSALTGATIVLVQINSSNVIAALPSLSALLVFAVLIGVITQDAIVNKNIDLSNYTLGINVLKSRLLHQWPEEMGYVFYLRNFWANVSPLLPMKMHLSSRIHRRWWWLFPLGTHQLFISIVNSFALAALALIAVQLLSSATVPIERLSLGGIILVVVSFEIHAIYAQTKHRRGTEHLVTAAGTEVTWATGAG
jgi:hypothetical protein